MSKRWFGRRGYFNINPEVPGGSTYGLQLSFDNPDFSDGDSLLRILFGWQMTTALTDGAGVPDRGPWPMFVTARFSPDPDGDPPISTPPFGGDALWRESVAWRKVYFTDGAVHSFGWEAHSGPMRSGQGQRKTIDKTVALVEAVASFDTSGADNFPSDTAFIPLDVFGFLWFEILVEQA